MSSSYDPALTVALALIAGMVAQVTARHLRLPGIVLLLGAGVLLGPDGVGLVRPATLGHALEVLVGFAVAVILFEGGLNLDIRRLRRQAAPIRRLVTLGALMTTAGGTLLARYVLGWPWRLSILFGTLVIVTGPTVITPLLRRIRVRQKVATVLEAEGVFGDAIGALAAVVALEASLGPPGQSLVRGLGDFIARFGVGILVGAVGGALAALLLRRERWIPEGLQNVFILSGVLALYQISGQLRAESGVVTVVVAGLTLGNLGHRSLIELREFKEQLTVMFIGLLFVLLAADVQIAEVRRLGLAGLVAVVGLMAAVRPANVLLSTAGSELGWRERAFLSWLAPRGIVAAAVASLFAERLDREGIAGGEDLRALVFLVIAVTVLVQGLSGGLVASALGLRSPAESGYVILGANAVGRILAHALTAASEAVVLVDSNPAACSRAEEEGLPVVYGSALHESVLLRAGLEHREGCVGVTPNPGVNFTFARRARREFKVPKAWVALERGDPSVSAKMLERLGARILFGRPRRLEELMADLEHGRAETMLLRYRASEQEEGSRPLPEALGDAGAVLLPVWIRREERVVLVDENAEAKDGDELASIVPTDDRDAVAAELAERGWKTVPSVAFVAKRS